MIHFQEGDHQSIWTEDLDKAEKLSRMVQSGVVSVNNIASNPRVPFGGVKKSGFGRVIQIWYARVCQYQVS